MAMAVESCMHGGIGVRIPASHFRGSSPRGWDARGGVGGRAVGSSLTIGLREPEVVDASRSRGRPTGEAAKGVLTAKPDDCFRYQRHRQRSTAAESPRPVSEQGASESASPGGA